MVARCVGIEGDSINLFALLVHLKHMVPCYLVFGPYVPSLHKSKDFAATPNFDQYSVTNQH